MTIKRCISVILLIILVKNFKIFNVIFLESLNPKLISIFLTFFLRV